MSRLVMRPSGPVPLDLRKIDAGFLGRAARERRSVELGAARRIVVARRPADAIDGSQGGAARGGAIGIASGRTGAID